MPVRLLIAVLMLVGPLPVRACTCAAAARTCSAPAAGAGVPTGHAPETAGCRCRAKSAADPTDDPSEARPPVCRQAGDSDGHPHHDGHDRDCPAVNPAPARSATVSASAPDAAADPELSAAPPRVEPSGLSRSRAVVRPIARPVVGAVPVYISLLSIRV